MTFDTNSTNLPLLEELYNKYQEDPTSVDPSWSPLFSVLERETPLTSRLPLSEAPADLRIYHLIEAYRTYGHLAAQIDPIALTPVEEPWQLHLETLGFGAEELKQEFPTCGLLSQEKASLEEIIKTLKEIYCGKIGIEYMGLEDPVIKAWLQEKLELAHFRPQLSIDQKKMVLQQLNRSELFESFIHTKYTGQKRFSLEGAETLIPMLETVVEIGNQLGIEQFVIGMAHRGRLNVLSNILNKSHIDIFSEFEEGYIPNSFEGSGDVKYHKGFYSEVTTPKGNKVQITLAPNPSHLESVGPVVEGQVKAKQLLIGDEIKQERVIPILIHGDAAISGQGIVYETLELYRLPGYSTGGTLHFVINNQIGFTAVPSESRSTRYCTDIAKGFNAPIFHVNAEDPEGCVFVTNLAIELRQKFHCEVFIDLNCYRKYGHNESDEPAYTQPLEYQLIRKKKPIRELYRDQLIHQGVVEKDLAESLEKEFTEGLQKALQETKVASKVTEKNSKKNEPDYFLKIDTAVSEDILKSVAQQISKVPEGFTIHPKLHHLVEERLQMIIGGEKAKPIDWGTAELLAYGTLLWQGRHVRISGQDSRRGTFSHRHAIWMDQVVEKDYCPLSHLKQGQGRFDVINSSLSEYAVLGFEFGYSSAYQDALVIWEAQFGDFCNTAQVMIDQYISTAEQKWGQKFSLTLFLPHGYEGQGPEHSSGRMERFLSLCGNDNMRVVNPTTPAQFFHLLRKQVLDPIRKPLVVFTPKGLLRHPECVSQLKDLTTGTFRPILDDVHSETNVKRVVFCCGRIYYDLIAERAKRESKDLAIIRLEQLYPLDVEALKELVKKYSAAEEYLWVQEEPYNMGAWGFIHPLLNSLIPTPIKYIGRPRSSSPAVGSYALHKKQHAELLSALFG